MMKKLLYHGPCTGVGLGQAGRRGQKTQQNYAWPVSCRLLLQNRICPNSHLYPFDLYAPGVGSLVQQPLQLATMS